VACGLVWWERVAWRLRVGELLQQYSTVFFARPDWAVPLHLLFHLDLTFGTPSAVNASVWEHIACLFDCRHAGYRQPCSRLEMQESKKRPDAG